MIQANHLMIQANRNVKLFGSFSLVLLTLFLIAGLFCLGIGLKISFIMELTEELTGATGFGTDVDSVTQSDLSVDLIVLSETTTIPSPEELDVGIAGNSSLHILNFTHLGGAKA